MKLAISHLIVFVVGMLVARKHPEIANWIANVLTLGRSKASDIISQAKARINSKDQG